MIINRSIDIEDAVRAVLSDYMTAYCRPLPAEYSLPNVLVTTTGGDTDSTASGRGKVDHFMVVLDVRAETESEAMELIRTAVAVLESEMPFTEVNSLYSWGADPIRPDLAMCSATLMVTAHREIVTL